MEIEMLSELLHCPVLESVLTTPGKKYVFTTDGGRSFSCFI